MKTLIISEFEKGKSNSPYTGFSEIRNLNIHKQRGSVQLSYKPKQVTDETIFTGRPQKIERDSSGRYYVQLSSAEVLRTSTSGLSWATLAGNTLTYGSGNGMIIWKNHLFVARETYLDVFKISTGQWFNNFSPFSNSGQHPMYIGGDGILYIGDGNLVVSIQAIGSFNASNPASYIINTSALDIPSEHRITDINMIGRYLLLGTESTIGRKEAFIFPWDVTNATSFEMPIRIYEYGINKMIYDGNQMYVSAGYDGNIYVTNTTSFSRVTTIPGEFNDSYNGTVRVYDMMFMQGKLMVAVGVGNATARGAGVYSWDGKSWCVENSPSTLGDGSSNIVNITCLFPISTDEYLLGYQDGSTYSVENVGGITGLRYTNYSGYLETGLIQLNGGYNVSQYQIVTIKLGKKLAPGMGIRIKYRSNLTDDFTTMGTYTYSTYGAVSEIPAPAELPSMTSVQFRIELNPSESESLSPELVAIIFS